MSFPLSAMLSIAVALIIGWSLLRDLRQGKIRVANFFIGQSHAEKAVDPLVFWGVFSLKAAIALVVLFSLGSNMLRTGAMSPLTQAEFRRYTGIGLCSGDRLTDRSSNEERDTTPGFAFHAELQLARSCVPTFEDQLTELSPRECAPARMRTVGCVIGDGSRRDGKHTNLIVTPLAKDRYEVRFWQ